MSHHPESKWTHQICVPCWNDKRPENAVDSETYNEGDDETCCYCDRTNSSGIYLKEDPVAVHGEQP